MVINAMHTRCCKNCNNFQSVAVSLVSLFLPITVFFFIVIIFRPNFASGPMLGYIVYCQGYAVVMKTNSGFYYSLLKNMQSPQKRVFKASLSLSGIWWYLEVIFFFFPDQCINKYVSDLSLVSIEYIYVLYPLLLIFITWLCIELHARDFRLVVYLWKPFHKCFAKVRRNWSASDSVIHAYATFFFLSFTCLTYASYHMLYTTYIYNINGTLVRKVLVHEPTMESFSPQHLPYAIPAILLLFFLGVCPTLFLCLYPIRVFRKCFCRFSSRSQLTVKIFVDAFQSCYKDGLNDAYDFRYLSFVPFLLVLLLVPVHCVMGILRDEMYYATLFSFGMLVIAAFFSYVRPYKTLYMNFSISFHSVIFSLISMIRVIWYEGHIMSAHSLATLFTCLSLLPHIFALATLVYHILRRIRFFRTNCERLSEIISAKFCQLQADIAESLPDRLQNSSAYKTLSVMH